MTKLIPFYKFQCIYELLLPGNKRYIGWSPENQIKDDIGQHLLNKGPLCTQIRQGETIRINIYKNTSRETADQFIESHRREFGIDNVFYDLDHPLDKSLIHDLAGKDYVYTLLLHSGMLYVGTTKRILSRITEHYLGEGADWTEEYPPISILSYIPGNQQEEEKQTLLLMQQHGIENVRGSKWTSLNTFDLPSLPKSIENTLGNRKSTSIKRKRTSSIHSSTWNLHHPPLFLPSGYLRTTIGRKFKWLPFVDDILQFYGHYHDE